MRSIAPLVLILSLHTEACRDSNAQTTSAQGAAPSHANDSTGRFVSHVEHIQPGGMPVPRGMVLRNPYEGNAGAVATGAKLYVAYNCIDCDGAEPRRRTLALRRDGAGGVRVDLPGSSRRHAGVGLAAVHRPDLGARDLRALARAREERHDGELLRRHGRTHGALTTLVGEQRAVRG